MLFERGIQSNRLLNMRDRGERLPAINSGETADASRRSIVRIEPESRVGLRRGSVEIPRPEICDRGDIVYEGDLRALA